MLASILNPLKTVSYSLDLSYYNGGEVTQGMALYLNKWYKISIRNETVSLKIKLERNEALEQSLTLRRLYNDQVTSDVEVHCGAMVIKAHKFILSTHSETLRVAFSSEGLKEGRTGIYRIEEEHWSPEILQYIVRWMYMHCIENAGDKAWVYFRAFTQFPSF
jgi:hypothetical protein